MTLYDKIYNPDFYNKLFRMTETITTCSAKQRNVMLLQ